MSSLKRNISDLTRALLRDERGQSTTEYILIMAVVVMIAMKFRKMFESKVGSMLNNLGTELDNGMSGGGGGY